MDNTVLPSVTPNDSRPRKPFHKVFLFLAILIAVLLAFFSFNQFKGAKKLHGEPQKFELTESSPLDQDGEFATFGQPTFVFSKSIGVSEADLGNYFRMSPSVDGTWHLEKNGQVVYFSSDRKHTDGFPPAFAYNTVYTITINKDFHSSDNQKLPEDIHIAFRTMQNPLFRIRSDKKLIATPPNQGVSITFHSFSSLSTYNPGRLTAGSPLTVTIQEASEDQLLHYFSYKERKNPLYEFRSNSPSNEVKQFQSIVQSGQATDTYQITLGNDTFPNPGLYFLTLKAGQDNEDLFVVVSNHINQVFNDAKNTYIWTADQRTGEAISGVTTKIFQMKNEPRLLDTVVTGNDGIAKSTQAADTVDFIISHTDDDIAVTPAKTYDYYGYTTSSGTTYQVFSYSDRPVYRPGDTVHYKAVIRKKGNAGYVIPSGTFYTQLLLDYQSSDVKDNYTPLDIDQNGTVTFDTQLPELVPGSYRHITLSTKTSDGTYEQINSFPLLVESYRKPDMDITATALEKEYISSDEAHFSVFAKTTYGQPLTNVDFSYRVLVSSTSEVKDRTTEYIQESVSGYYGSGNELVSGAGKFDDKGVAQITFSTALPSQYELSQIATLEVTPNIGAAPSIGKIAKLIHRGEFALFIDELTGDTENGINGTVTALNHAIPRQAVPDKPITLSLYKVITYDTKQLVLAQNVTAGADGATRFSFENVENGSYEVVAQGNDSRGNTVTVRHQLFVGQQQQYTSSQPQYTLNLKTHKNTYRVNETANVAVSANFVMNDVVVVLTNSGDTVSNIISLAKNQIDNSSWTLPVEVKDGYGQGVGIDVFAVHNGMVIRGYTNFAIDREEQKIHTTISFDKQVYKPADTVLATITTKDTQGNPLSADASLSVIDASILQIGQLRGNIFELFYPSYPSYPAVAHYDSTTGILRNAGGGGGGCFLAGTKILMSDGSSKNIEDVQIGDRILTRVSDASPQLVEDTVEKTFRHAVTDYLTINNNLNVTWVHSIYINGQWRQAKDAKVGDMLLDENGNRVEITSITPHTGQFIVYNLTTSRYHTFFANGLYVHNQKGIDPRQNFADTAYWNPHIQTNANGQATISFTLPDNLTTYTAQVFANTKDSHFGETTAEFASQKDFNIIPAIANFYYQGDKPHISTLIQNSSQNDSDVEVSLTVKELGMTKNQSLQISKGDFATATFPIAIDKETGSLSFLVALTDKSGNMLDSVSVTKPILPKGNIVSSWYSFQGSHNTSFTATYPNLDFNTVYLSLVPNIVSRLFHSSSIYFTYQPSVAAGQELYAYSYILARTRDGFISPTSYDYARLKNNFRDAVVNLIQTRTGTYWITSYDESFDAMNLWIAHGLSQAQHVHMLDEITNISSIVEETKQYTKTKYGELNPSLNFSVVYSYEDQIARQWILNEQIRNVSDQNSPESLAIRILNGNQSLLSQLRLVSLASANDRYIWGGTQVVLPALAMIEKGSQTDADRAIKGLSFALADFYSNPLALLAGVKYAERSNFQIDEPAIKVSVNDHVAYATKPNQQYSQFTKSFPAKNSKDGKITLKIEALGNVPVYSTIVQTDYNNHTNTSEGDTSSPFTRINHLLKLDTAHTAGEAKVLDINLTRMYKDVKTGQDVSEIKQGTAGIVALTDNNEFSKHFKLTDNQSIRSATYAFLLEDAISPSFIYLNQTNNYSNNPQYQSVLNRIFPGDNVYYGNTTPPSYYSDEAVFFNGTPYQSTLIFPYVVYNVSGGTYYQPKTSIVFPVLGLISHEK